MVNFLGLLVKNPQPEHSATELVPNLKRFEYQSHIVFYIPKESHILIVRILHQRMDFWRHLPESLPK
ncbi:type II toxin-antitoxin system RelE/ParE family toxin [Nitrosomonas oligotropha]|uniref:type II toxin-antitoxin system RelE/ParE family toxin n=1 Tax=Nitrosomonas oligotropha TaxID=42354 RepID=UPI00136FD764|nr:type II toxin-antitoxin system RelE/ParE family toxin [Nitrosomonas oligotropha]